VKANLCLINGSQKGKEVVSRGIAHQNEVVGSVLVVAGSIQRHHALQECLRSLQHHTDRLSDMCRNASEAYNTTQTGSQICAGMPQKPIKPHKQALRNTHNTRLT